MGSSKQSKRNSNNQQDSSQSNTLVEEALNSNQAGDTKPLLALPPPQDYSTFVYPLSAFPPLSAFDVSVTYPALVIPARHIPLFRKQLTHILLNRPKLKIVYPLQDDDPMPGYSSDNNDNKSETLPSNQDRGQFRKILLIDNPNVFEDEQLLALQKQLQEEQLQSTKDNNNGIIKDVTCRTTHKVTASYTDWTVEQVLRRIIPLQEIPSSFETIGHLAHINLRDELLPFKHIIGKALLDKNAPRIKTVVNKVGTIETEFRTFGMEVIAGNSEPGWSNVVVKEEGCYYELDFQKVYWNSRLGGEHRRLVEIIRKQAAKSPEKNLVVADLMAGIGPFAVPLTARQQKGNISVHANDLNPSSFQYLVANSKRNKCQNLKCYNMDARAFCHHLQHEGIDFHHVLMNLPATAPEFLDAFRGFKGQTLPRIHVHCFSSKDTDEAQQATLQRCATALGCPLDATRCNTEVHMVRNVAPNKNMYCVSFDLPEAVRNLTAIDTSTVHEHEPDLKRTKLN